jgi:hypothetical protein
MKIKIYTLHARLRWGDDITEVHLSRSQVLVSAGSLLDEDEQVEFDVLVEAGKYDEADSYLEERLDSSGHEWSIEEHIIDTEKAEVVL